MRMPGLTAEHGIGPALGTYAATGSAPVGEVAVGMMIRYVSTRRKERILYGEEQSRCPSTYPYACFGVRHHKKGYVCCRNESDCAVMGDGRPTCREQLVSALRVNDPGFTEPALVNRILELVDS